MRLLYVIYRGYLGGLELHVARIAQCLKDRHEVCVAIVGDASNDPLINQFKEMGVRCEVLGCKSGHDIRLFFRFLRLMRDFRPSLVHAHAMPFLCLVAMWFVKKNIPFVASIHCPVVSPYSIVKRMLMRRIDMFLPVSQATQDGLVRFYPHAKGRSEVLFNPLDLQTLPGKDTTYARRELGLDSQVRLMGMVARMEAQKKWKEFLDVSCRVLMRNPNVHSIALGDGSQRDELHRYWEMLTSGSPDVRTRLHWLGRRADAKQIVGGLDVFLLISVWEELPTTLLEAFGMRTPVVGNVPRGGMVEVLELGKRYGTIGLFDPDCSVERMADFVERILSDSSLAASCTSAAHELLLACFDARKVFDEQLEAVYRNLLERKP